MARSSKFMQYLAAVTACVAYLGYGMFAGWPSPALAILEGEDSPIPLTSDQGSWVASISSLTQLTTMVCVPFTVDRIGRKKLLLATTAAFIGHWLLVAFADSYGMLMAARIVGSLGGGVLITVNPMYLSEIAEAGIRGALGTLHQVFLNLGTLSIYCIAPYTPLALSACVACAVFAVFFATFFWMPDSPYFFMVKGEEERAVETLLRLRGKSDPAELKWEINMMKKAVLLKEETRGKFKDLLFQRVHRRTFILLLGFSMLQLMSGASALLVYSTTIFEISGTGLDSNMCSIVIAAVQVVMSGVCYFLIDRVGRRPLMIGTFFGCFVTMAAEGTYFFFVEEYGEVPSAFDWVPLVALVGFQISYWVGIGTVLSAIMGEMYHVSVKGLASPVTSIINGFGGFLEKKMFQVVTDSVGAHWAFWGFASFMLIGTFYSYFLLPETKNKTFAEINEEMDARTSRREPITFQK